MSQTRSTLGGPATQGGSQRPRAESEEDPDDDDDANGPAQTQGSTALSEQEIKRKAGQLVRLALFNEYKRKPTNRTQIVKDVLDGRGRFFNAVFEQAQRMLRSTLGMELVGWRARQKVGSTTGREDGDGADGADGEQDGRRKNMSTRAFTLRSTLDPELVAAMSMPNALPILTFAADEVRPPSNDPEDPGSLLPWTSSDGSASGPIEMLGIRALVLSLVLTCGRVIADDHLHALLRRLHLHRDTILPFSNPDSSEATMTLDKYLDLLGRQGYLEKTTVAATHDDAPATFEWRWGPRHVEFGEKAAAMFIEQVFFGQDDSDDEGEEADENGEASSAQARRLAKRKRLNDHVARAAGGPLQGSL